MKLVTKEKMEKYLSVTGRALEAVKKGRRQAIDWDRMSDEFLDMASRYFRDAKFYTEKGDFVTAFAACNYAHGWIDAGVRLGLLSAPEGSGDYIMPRE